MGGKLFISDLHLSEQRPNTLALFQCFVRDRVADADELYILGDLFDVWLGDDDDSSLAVAVRKALRTVSDRGVGIYVQHGNRDFLLGHRFAAESGCELLDETVVINLAGRPTLLMHGDLLCTDDTDYQQARATLRAPTFATEFLAKTLAERAAIAAEYRRLSAAAVSRQANDVMDANELTVMDYMREHDVTQLIHGHTHRRATHTQAVEGRSQRRFVLGDWSETAGSVLIVQEDKLRYEAIT